MSDLTLGLDLGPQSIGWALIDEKDNRLIATGVRVFPEGVDRDTSGGEVSKNEQRRLARAIRRQHRRRAKRRRQLRGVLVEAGLLPGVAARDPDDPDRIAWERDAFQRADPYDLRRRALHEALEPHDLGRLLVHLNQRRGFRSNRKTDRERKKESEGILQEISELAADMGDKSLGEYLADQRGTDPVRYRLTRVRGRHTHRSMYEQEFERVWSAQQHHHPDILTDTLKTQIHRIIFFQRPLLPPSPGVVGRCELEPRLPRCPRADRRAQRFRMYQQVNNLRVLDTASNIERPLTNDERSTLLAYLCRAKSRTFDQIRRRLFEQHASVRFNLERGGRTKLEGMPTDAVVAHKSRFGPGWHDLPEGIKDRIVSAAIDDDEDRLRYLLGEVGAAPDLAETLLEVPFESGYSSYSLHAIKRLLPHVEGGMPLTSRGPDVPCALREAGYLMPWEEVPQQQQYLPGPNKEGFPDLTNPLVRQALHEVRKVVNAILREYVHRQGHHLAQIRIELAREVRGTAEQRRRRAVEMRRNEKRRDEAATHLQEAGVRPSREAITRYLLWEEQGRICIYSGRPIGFNQLVGGEVDTDHILPYSRSLDDSMMNKVVCFRSENTRGPDGRGKGDRTPHEWLANADPDKYEQVLQRARCFLPHAYGKYKRFAQESVELEDFFARQFVDTTYITSKVHQYVRCLGADVVCSKGQHTATLRHHWGLNTILETLGDSPSWEAAALPPGKKNRLDHRHHAIDAVVVGLTDRSRLQTLAAIRRRGGTRRTGEVANEPWPAFREDVEQAVRGIVASHRNRRRVSGGLHEETIYGPVRDDAGEPVPGRFVVRKPVEELSCSEVLSIRDDVVRKKVIDRLQQFGIEPGRGQAKPPPDVWREPLWMNENKRVPIRRVRLVRSDESVRAIRGGTSFVKPGRLHHTCIFEHKDARGRSRRYAKYVTLLEAKDRIRNRRAVVQRVDPDDRDAVFIMSLCPGDLLLAEFRGRERLVVVSTLVSTQQRIHIVDANDARPSAQKKNEGKTANSLCGRKVVIDPIGRIRWAND